MNTNSMKIVGIGIANALVALSGALVAQYQGGLQISVWASAQLSQDSRQ